ncbi:MAG: hypothetical protein IPL46_26045 [Saprospiraceae bacterium]|nr:hypothetical protein [Saprospiraceae bacterium]
MEIIEGKTWKNNFNCFSTSNRSRHEIIGEQTIADALLDRLVHTAHRIDIKGELMLKKLRNRSKFNHKGFDLEQLVCFAHFHPAHMVHLTCISRMVRYTVNRTEF